MNPTLEILNPRYENLRVSREEYLDLEEDGFRYDMEEGVLRLSPSPGFEHADKAGNFYYEIKKFLQKNPIAKAVAEIDVFFPDGGDVLRPDISVILISRLGIVKKHIHGSPDLVLEVLSPSTRYKDLGTKADRYLKNDVHEYWILDLETQKIEVWYNKKSHWQKISGEILESKILPGLVIHSKNIFC